MTTDDRRTPDRPLAAHGHDHGHDHSHDHGHDHGHGRVDRVLADASVRVARSTDAPAVGLVQAVVFRDAYADVLDPEVLSQLAPDALARAWRTSLEGEAAGDGVLLVACAGEQVVGLAAVGASPDRDADDATAELLVLGVHPEARRQGHGSRLLHAVVDTARGRGRDRLTAWALAGDADLLGFLGAAGLEPDGARRERVVADDGRTVLEVRLAASVGTDPEPG